MTDPIYGDEVMKQLEEAADSLARMFASRREAVPASMHEEHRRFKAGLERLRDIAKHIKDEDLLKIIEDALYGGATDEPTL